MLNLFNFVESLISTFQKTLKQVQGDDYLG